MRESQVLGVGDSSRCESRASNCSAFVKFAVGKLRESKVKVQRSVQVHWLSMTGCQEGNVNLPWELVVCKINVIKSDMCFFYY